MSATYPDGIVSFTPKVDHTDTIMAADVNSAYDEITAIETELGVDPKGALDSVVDRLGRPSA